MEKPDATAIDEQSRSRARNLYLCGRADLWTGVLVCGGALCWERLE
jgi:hypothetical protein